MKNLNDLAVDESARFKGWDISNQVNSRNREKRMIYFEILALCCIALFLSILNIKLANFPQ